MFCYNTEHLIGLMNGFLFVKNICTELEIFLSRKDIQKWFDDSKLYLN